MRYCTFLFAFAIGIASGQPSTEAEIRSSFELRKKMAGTSLLKEYPVRNIGPTVQGGRIVDIDVNLNHPEEFYVGYASGGIFRTQNNGITFEPVFDGVDAMGIGDFALSQTDTKVLYAGTGEKNSSRSSYAGSGLYKTVDGGKNWEFIGLAHTQHISRILIHPADNNTVWVASLGALYSHNADRGVFKTADGGKTWKKVLFVNDSTGIVDLAINPQNPNQLWASAWERTRKAWHFKGNGEGSAIYRSDDSGETWTKTMAGFPSGKTVGRIGLEVSASNPAIIYAILDNQGEGVEEKKKDDGKLKLTDFKEMTTDNLLKLEDKILDDFLKDNSFPKRYNAARVKKEVREGKYTPKAIADYFGGDANANLFDANVVGADLYRSDDNGSTWKRMNSYDLDGVFYTYGYYFAEMKISPTDPELVYIYGVPMLKSKDGGRTWAQLDTVGNVHSDHHALWVNPKNPKHLLLGNDGGLYQSYDEGANWLHINNMPVGQFYTVNVDMETPYNVYGGLQDNGVLMGSSRSVPNRSKHWEEVFGGDGMFVAADPRDSRLVYTGFQFGNYWRLERDKRKVTRITPQHDIGEAPLRWNWRTPVILSKHNPDIVYMAAQKVFRSLDKADNLEAIGGDLTLNRPQGNVPFSTIASLAESPLQFGLLYAGTDDGLLWVSRDAGGNWERIDKGLPQNKWVSSVSPSPHDKATLLVSLNGYRDDDFRTYLYVSTDYGANWTPVVGDLPESVANVIIQDPVNPDLLYCGLDNGTWASLDRGKTWNYFNGMLNVASYDMVVHPRENELVVGTHGRSVFVADVKPLQGLKDGGTARGIAAFAPESIRYSERWGEKSFEWDKPNTPNVSIRYYVGKASPSVNVEILDEKNIIVRRLTTSGAVGFHTLNWDVRLSPPVPASAKSKAKAATVSAAEMKFAQKGKYKVKFVNETESSEVTVEVK